MTEGTGAEPSLVGSRALDKFLKAGKFDYEYLEVDGNHGSMVPMVWPNGVRLLRQGVGAEQGWATHEAALPHCCHCLHC